MANNFDSNFSRKLMQIFLEKFESSRVLSKSVNTQLLDGKFNPTSGTVVDFKRPHDYNAIETAGGDISQSTKSDIISGKASGTVQNYITVATEWANVDEALKLNQLDEILEPMATRIVTTLEKNFGQFMYKNCNLSYGTPGTRVSTWGHVAGAGSLMDSIGVPKDKSWYYAMNPFTVQALADAQKGIYNDSLVKSAWERAQLPTSFGGMKAISSNALPTYTAGVGADRAGTLSGTPTATYVAHKDTMIQSLAVAGLQASGTVKAGEIVEVTGRYRLNLSTRDVVLGADGLPIKWRGVVTEDATLSGTGTGTLLVAGPAIREANGQYNTVDTALTSGDVITILNTAATLYQPNMFFHPDAFGIATVKLPKLYSTDTVGTTRDGFSIRVCKYADGDANTQKIRFDLLPAFACFNPFFAGQGFGVV